MVSATGAANGRAAPAGGMPPRSSPSLDAQLATCRGQLADWVTCPSAKTPEGKARIAQITDRMDAIKQQMKSAGKAAEKATGNVVKHAADQAAVSPAAPRPGATLGGNVDVFA